MHLDFLDLLLLLIALTAVLGIQIFLSTRGNRLYGLILPLITFGHAIYIFKFRIFK